MPVTHGLGNFFEILDGRLQWNGALRADQLHARIEVFVHLLPHFLRTLGEKRLGIIDIADQRNPVLDDAHRFRGIVLGVVMERGHAGLRNVLHAVDGAPTDMQDEGTG